MVNKVAFINGKGGCGKTTSIFHVAGVIAKAGGKVLVIDFDKQRNTTDTLLMNTEVRPEKTVLDFMQGTATAEEVTGKALFQTRGNANPRYYGVDCMSSDVRLKDEALVRETDGRMFGERLDDFIEQEGYTWVLVDMPPSNEALNDICFAHIVDYVIIPFSSDVFSVSGYGDIMDTVQQAREINDNLNILGVYLSRYMENCAVDRYIKEQLQTFGNMFIDVQIPLMADLREGVMFGRPMSFYKMFSKSRTAYESLVDEMINRINQTK
jgi:chromosome partitioning protein